MYTYANCNDNLHLIENEKFTAGYLASYSQKNASLVYKLNNHHQAAKHLKIEKVDIKKTF